MNKLRKRSLDTTIAVDFAEKPAKPPARKKNRRRDTSPPEGDKRLVVNVSEETHRLLKVQAALQDSTMGEMVERMVREYVAGKTA